MRVHIAQDTHGVHKVPWIEDRATGPAAIYAVRLMSVPCPALYPLTGRVNRKPRKTGKSIKVESAPSHAANRNQTTFGGSKEGKHAWNIWRKPL